MYIYIYREREREKRERQNILIYEIAYTHIHIYIGWPMHARLLICPAAKAYSVRKGPGYLRKKMDEAKSAWSDARIDEVFTFLQVP